MTSLGSSLLSKLKDREYFCNLSERRRKELLFASKYLTEEELQTLSSIDVAYNIARQRYIEKRNLEVKYRQPIFGIFKEIEDLHSLYTL